MPQPADATRLLMAASRAETLPEQQRLMAEAAAVQGQIAARTAAEREVDFASAVVAERLTPAPVHEHHTAATDWLGDIDTSAPADIERDMVAQGSVWYSKVHEAVKQHPDELAQQAIGMAQRIAGRFGAGADAAEKAFLDHVGVLHARDVQHGLVVVANGPGVEGEQVTMGLPEAMTSSERAPAMQDLMNNTGGGSVSDRAWPDPLVLPQQDVDAANGDSGTQRVATSRVAAPNAHGADIPEGTPGEGADGGFTHYPGVDNPEEVSRQMRGMSTSELRRSHDRLVQQGHEEHGLTKLLRDHIYIRDQGFGFLNTSAKAPFYSEDAGTGVHERERAAEKPKQDHDDDRDPRDDPEWQRHHNAQRGTPMQQRTAACPECRGCRACGGTHRVAVRVQGASGLDQIDQTIDSHDNPKATPYPTAVAFPWEMPADSSQAIQETEQQLAEREQRKGAAYRAAQHAAQLAYRQVMAGQDDSGWLGDMGAGGVRPGMQDGGNPGNTYPGNLADQDPVYGQGGDNGNQPLKPYGADEANDYTNNPGMNIQPGAPMQYDQAGRGNQVGQPTASYRPSDSDPEIARAQSYIRQRRALLDGRR